MAITDATKQGVTIMGNHFHLYYALQKAREDHVTLYEEIKEFDPKEKYSKYPPKAAQKKIEELNSLRV